MNSGAKKRLEQDGWQLSKEAYTELVLAYKFRDAIRCLAGGITHEYNNIFAGLSGQLSLQARDGKGAGYGGERHRMVESLLQRGIEKTSMFFEFCRLRGDSKKLLQPRRLAEKAVVLLSSVSRIHHVDLHCRHESTPQLKGSYRDLLLMLFYLGENGIQATPEGGLVQISLQVSVDAGAGLEIVFSVKDGGGGFPPSVLARFGRGGAEREEDVSAGPCFGLSAVSAIVAAHGGRLALSNREGGGALAEVAIPAAIDEFSALENIVWGVQDKRPKNPPRGDHYVFLVIEDEESIRMVLLDQLQRRGHVAFCVSSCEEALEEFRELADIITAVLVDVGLPDCSGYDCVTKLRQIDDGPKIIIMSGNEFADRTNGPGDVHYLRKPFTVDMIEEVCRS